MRIATLASLLVLTLPAAAQTVIDFDDQPGWKPGTGFIEGIPVRPGALVTTEYLSSGVLFDAPGGGLARSAPSNPVSAPNTVAATTPGHLLTYLIPADASFWFGDAPATVDYVQLTLTGSSSLSTLEVFDFQGTLLGTSSGGASAMLRVDAPGAIHSARIQQGPMAFDDFIFDGLTPIGAFAVSAPQPGRTGALNTIVVTGAAPHEPVLLRIDIEGERSGLAPLSAALLADATGRAEYSFFVPRGLDGLMVSSRVLGQLSGASPAASDVLAPALRRIKSPPVAVGPLLAPAQSALFTSPPQ